MNQALKAKLARIREYTMTSPECIETMIKALKYNDANGVRGDVVECGVWKGGNLILARAYSSHRVCWAYDTFAGMTPPEEVDGEWANKKFGIRSQIGHMSNKSQMPGKWLAIPLQDVKNNLRAFGVLDDTMCRFVEGPVEQTLRDPNNLPEQISLLRLDTDWHASTKIELQALYPRLVPGGALIVDDYGHWQGSRIATDDYFAGQLAFEYIDDKKFSVIARKPC